MLLTLCASSIKPLIHAKRGGMHILDVPAFARDTLGLHGLNLSTDLLKGSTRADLESLRDRSDKAACSCLLLSEPEPLRLADPKDAKAEAGVERAMRVLRAAQVLGCNSASIATAAADTDENFDLVCIRLREIVEVAERLEINLLISPASGLTESADRVTDLIKRVGGFRIGTLPDFESAADAEDPVTYLRRITPYAAVVIASTKEFGEPEETAPSDKPLSIEDLLDVPVPVHESWDLGPMVEAVVSVGFDITLGLNYLGAGDPVMGLISSRDALEAAIEDALDK
jgi:sugar phosphate isomerase/epimerase